MKTTSPYPNDAKQLFRQCGTCAQTFGHLLNREFDNNRDAVEKALDPLAGGLMNNGHQCGMLWGAALAASAEAFRREKDPEKATALAIHTTQKLLDSFAETNQTHNCREIIGCDLTTFWGLAKLGWMTLRKGMDNSPCFKMAEAWAPEAIEAASTGLASRDTLTAARSCARELALRMGASEEESSMVAGFAGGMGLSGNACGALGAAIWIKTLQWCKDHPGEILPSSKNKAAQKLLAILKEETEGKMLCKDITGRKFETVDEHTAFLQAGGCHHLIDKLVEN